MATLTATVAASITGNYSTAHDLDTAAAPFALRYSSSVTSGTGNGACDLYFGDTRTIALSSTENIDVAAALTGSLGETLAFVKVKGLFITAAAANTNNVVVGGAASNTLLNIFGDATDKIVVKPGGCFLWFSPNAGAAVTAATGDILLVANSGAGTGVTYSIEIIGTSA